MPIRIDGKTPEKIRELEPSFKDWSVTSNVVTTAQMIVGIIINNQASAGNCIISESIVDNMRVYAYCYGDKVD